MGENWITDSISYVCLTIVAVVCIFMIRDCHQAKLENQIRINEIKANCLNACRISEE
jgi:hypothetical protein